MTPDIHTLAGAYVLDAVDPEERAGFEAHLAECESCRDEVAALRGTAAALAASEAAPPPESLRTKVMAAAAQTPQLPPLARGPTEAPSRGSTSCPPISSRASSCPRRSRRTWTLIRSAVRSI